MSTDFKNLFTDDLKADSFRFWCEALAQLRQLHNDIWNGVRFFSSFNSIIIAGFLATFRFPKEILPAPVNAIRLSLILMGILITIIATNILNGHRKYYVAMLQVKTLVEKELGFYDHKLHGVDLSFPWKVPAKYVDPMAANPKKWRKEHQWRWHTRPEIWPPSPVLSVYLLVTYVLFFLAYIGLLVLTIVLWR